MKYLPWSLFLFLASSAWAQGQLLPTETLPDPGTLWVDPAFGEDPFFGFSAGTVIDRAAVWFDEQLLGDGQAFQRRIDEFAGRPRSELRTDVVRTLKHISTQSFAAARSALDQLEAEGKISNVRQNWIINGFTCELHAGGLEGLQTVPGVKNIFRGLPLAPGTPTERGPRFVPPEENPPLDPRQHGRTWHLELIQAARVWDELNVFGKGVLNVIHDFGFRLDVPPLTQNLYRNPDEIADNGLDDDGNGYADDYHGYNFQYDSPVINTGTPNARGIIHGNVVTGLIAGGLFVGSNVVAGVAPRSQWAGVIALPGFELAIEWAIEHGADTYTMSFSLPNLRELRSHWRKVMEHGTLAGMYFVSGAGNFANPNNSNFAPVPVQMRTPEDIPGAVFSVAGVSNGLSRPSFSSQGPVAWQTAHYQDSTVAKPDFATFNVGLPYINSDGRLLSGVNGNSVAGPHLTGVMALMLAADPDLLPWDAMDILKTTATDILETGYDFQSGYGLVNAYEAVKEVLARKQSQVSTEEEPQMPASKLVLHPNYPNPFHTQTTIRYRVEHPSFVTLKIYDLLGREVAAPVAAWHTVGTHEVTFEAQGLPGGLYFYRLQTNTTMLSKLMTRVR